MDDHELIHVDCDEVMHDGCDLTDSGRGANGSVGDENAEFDDPRAVAASTPYVERWRRLVSTTNWEKGRIILEWREALRQSGAPPSSFSDEAWSRRAGDVTPQHVGRLRRVFERFGATCHEYDGLYWSHFHAALDWNDAELWLEGAARNRWSIAAMRAARREALGAPADRLPGPEAIFEAEIGEDDIAPPADPLEEAGDAGAAAQRTSEVRGTDRSSPLAGGERDADDAETATAEYDTLDSAPAAARDEPIRPFAGLVPLPVDLDDAVEAMKLAILRHKAAGWAEVSVEAVLDVLDALRALALAPREG